MSNVISDNVLKVMNVNLCISMNTNAIVQMFTNNYKYCNIFLSHRAVITPVRLQNLKNKREVNKHQIREQPIRGLLRKRN